MPKTIKLTFHSYWHCGSGLGAGAKADALVVKDADGLPFVPGKTIKGLVREAVATLVDIGVVSEAELKANFGIEGTAKAQDVATLQGTAFFSDATLPERKAIVKEKGLAENLYSLMASTCIDADGVARDHTLRSVEVVVPCEVKGYISGLSDTMASHMKTALGLVRRLGVGRNRGLGRCTFTCDETADEEPIQDTDDMGEIPDTVQLTCHLVTDVILNQKSASEGNNKTLDFIPGSCFLGISAGQIYANASADESFTIFHSGKVRFGDAHPLFAEGEGEAKMRSLRVPASFFYPKLGDMATQCYVHHIYNRAEDEEGPDGQPMQLKQCRTGFYAFMEDDKAHEVRADKSFAIKSAHDTATRRSRDNAMYGYESLRPGVDMGFSVEFGDDVKQDVRRRVIGSLTGRKRIGRSRTAQYGQVDIAVGKFNEAQSSAGLVDIRSSDNTDKVKALVVYADSRLIFLSECGTPVFQPTPQVLGLPESARIRHDMSQIRTFQYSPWNAKRQCFDADRCGIEKGSVIVVEIPEGVTFNTPKVVGDYRTEGFGHVVCNPAFLATEGKNGKAKVEFIKGDEKPKTSDAKEGEAVKSALLEYLKTKSGNAKKSETRYSCVNEFVEKNKGLFSGKTFASQWGAIRQIAAACPDKEALIEALFGENENGFLTHGVAKDQWSERNRKNVLRKFIEEKCPDVATVVNLASEMAKACR